MASDGEIAVNNILETMWMEAIVAWFEVLFRNSRGRPEETDEYPWNIWRPGPKFQSDTSRTSARRVDETCILCHVQT
jgi:hypothetical protein